MPGTHQGERAAMGDGTRHPLLWCCVMVCSGGTSRHTDSQGAQSSSSIDAAQFSHGLPQRAKAADKRGERPSIRPPSPFKGHWCLGPGFKLTKVPGTFPFHGPLISPRARRVGVGHWHWLFRVPCPETRQLNHTIPYHTVWSSSPPLAVWKMRSGPNVHPITVRGLLSLWSYTEVNFIIV
jgi:hypothetical protein